MSKVIPIKDEKVIKKIKDFYISNKNYRDLLFFLLAINTGLKLSFLLSLNISDVKEKESIRIVDEEKNINREIFFNEEIKSLIKKICINSRDNEPLFRSKRGFRLERTTAFRNFKRVCKDLMLETDISLQSLRKTFGFHYYQKTKDLLFLQNFFNQPSIAQTIDFIDLDRNLDCNFNLNFVVNF